MKHPTEEQSENAENNQARRLGINGTGAQFRSQYPYNKQSTQTSITPAPRVPVSSSGLCTCTGTNAQTNLYIHL